MALSVAAGRPVECDRMSTFADGLAVRVAVPLAVEELVRLGTPFVEVSERAMARAVGAFAAAGLRVEGSAAAALAALEVVDAPDGPIVLVVTGRNIDDELYRRAVERPETFPRLARGRGLLAGAFRLALAVLGAPIRSSVACSASIRSGAGFGCFGSDGAFTFSPFCFCFTTRWSRSR